MLVECDLKIQVEVEWESVESISSPKCPFRIVWILLNTLEFNVKTYNRKAVDDDLFITVLYLLH